MDGGGGDDRAFVQDDDAVFGVQRVVTVQVRSIGKAIRIEGTPAFVDRVRADLGHAARLTSGPGAARGPG